MRLAGNHLLTAVSDRALLDGWQDDEDMARSSDQDKICRQKRIPLRHDHG